jgi:hypothetical protein
MNSQKVFRLGGIHPLALLIGLVVVMASIFWIAKSVFKLLSFIAPVILLAAIIVNYRVVLGYGRWLLDSLKRNPFFGIVAILFTFFAFPLVSIFLLIRALSSKGVISKERRSFDKYEEVDDDFMDLSDLKKQKTKLDNDYNDVF